MSVWTSTLKATPPERQRAISSPSTTLDRKSPPAPPYSGGNSRPRKPSSPSRRQKDLGICPAVSHSATCGVTSFSTKARMLFLSIPCSWVNILGPSEKDIRHHLALHVRACDELPEVPPGGIHESRPLLLRQGRQTRSQRRGGKAASEGPLHAVLHSERQPMGLSLDVAESGAADGARHVH